MKNNILKLVVAGAFLLGVQSCTKEPSVTITNNNEGLVKLNELESEYQHIIFYGQSLAMGWEAAEALTTQGMVNNFMLGTNPNFKYAENKNELRGLVASKWVNGGEQPIVAAVNAFSYRYRTEVRKGKKFIATTGGEGGRSIEQLSKEFIGGEELYKNTFVAALNNGKAIAQLEKSTIACPAIIYMQGEFNYSGLNGGLGFDGADATTSKNEYKQLLVKLKNNMQNDVMQIYSQKTKPKFFIYQVAGSYIRNREMTINMAQLEFALENEDVVLLNPTYFTSDYGGGHLSSNGYRWYGESIAKSLYKALLTEEDTKPIYPLSYDIAGNKITIKMHVPTLPLVIDTWTTQIAQNSGFAVFKDGIEIQINSVQTDQDKVMLTTNVDLTGAIQINYAGNTRNGTGNLRDSHYFPSYYAYFDTSKSSRLESYVPERSRTSNDNLYGVSYPLQNWCVPFYYTINK